jgi:hypothetical protein
MADQPETKKPNSSLVRAKQNGDSKLRAELVAKDQQLASRFKEIAALTALLRAEEEKNARMREELGWIVGLLRRISNRPRWWSLLPTRKRRAREQELLRRAGLFDSATYMEIHPDVAQSGAEPLDHYLLHGLIEGRSRGISSDEGPDATRR